MMAVVSGGSDHMDVDCLPELEASPVQKQQEYYTPVNDPQDQESQLSEKAQDDKGQDSEVQAAQNSVDSDEAAAQQLRRAAEKGDRATLERLLDIRPITGITHRL
ncbi:hypothetical protein MRX96_003835 [Rhipicephalus microplus]